MKLRLGKKNYISLILLAVIAAALVAFVIYPLIRGIKEGSEQLLLEKEAQLTFAEEIENFQNFKEAYQEIKPNLEKAEGLLAIPEPPIEFINFLEQTAFNSNVLLGIFSVELRKTEKEIWPFLDFRLQASCSFSDFSEFIEKLENGSYLIEIYDFGIARSESSPGAGGAGTLAGNVSASFSLRVFTK